MSSMNTVSSVSSVSKRSKVVSLGLVPAVAAWFASCGSQQPVRQPPTHQQICADQDNRVVDDQFCVERDDRRGANRSGGGFFPYHWYYMPYRAGGYPIGFDAGHAAGGSLVAPTAGNGARVAAGRVVTGGFGSTATGSIGA